MLKIATKTKLSPEEAIKQAIDFFGPNGYKLDIEEQSSDCAYFKGGGGSVDIIACIKENETSVELSSTEWDYQVKKFIAKIH